MIPCSYISQLVVFPLIFSPWETGFPRIHPNLLSRPFSVPLCPWVQLVCFWTLSVQRGNTVFSLIANRFGPQFLSTIVSCHSFSPLPWFKTRCIWCFSAFLWIFLFDGHLGERPRQRVSLTHVTVILCITLKHWKSLLEWLFIVVSFNNIKRTC